MANKLISVVDGMYECPNCAYRWNDSSELDFNEEERVPCCPDCGELIEDGDDE